MFRFADDHASAATETAEARRLLELLPPLVPEIRSLWVGTDGRRTIAGERNPAAFDLVLVTTHDSWEALDDYQSHAEHVRLTTFIRERMTSRAVVDSAD